MKEVTVPVQWCKQELPYFCGPAVGQMVLASLGQTPPPGRSWQQQLWCLIKQLTRGHRPPGVACTEPSFPNQECERVGRGWNCWATSPSALLSLLNTQQIAKFSLRRLSDQAQATDALTQVLDGGHPGVALLDGWEHWAVIDGYTYDPVASRLNVTGVYLRDSNASGPLSYMPLWSWTWGAWPFLL